MNHASLFSGIGGFDLAAEWMGWTNVLHCERDPFCQRVLKYHFPNAKTYNDVKTFNGTEWRGRVDILTGGFPCQPYSSAGKRLGKDDERHLWPEMCRIISEVAPAYVVGENVRGLLNWNGGVVFEEVCADLEYLGYEVWTGIIPAAGVGAPHRRDRIWWVASHPNSNGWKRRMHTERPKLAKINITQRNARPHTWENFLSQSPVCGGDDGLPRQLDGVTFPKWRNESLKAYGNAIVPQLAFQLFRAIECAKQ